MLERLELLTLDLRFRFANSFEAGDEIVCLDITDRDLETIGRWPWPRDLQAPLIAIPAACGARAILVDITWTEPQPARTETAEFSDIVQDATVLTRGEPPPPIFPDLVLRRAIADANCVYLAYHHALVDIERSAAFARLVDLMVANHEVGVGATVEQLEASLHRRVPDADDYALQRPLDRARLVRAFIENPTLTEDEVAARFPNFEPFFRERVLERGRDAALRRQLRAWLNERPERWNQAPAELVAVFFATLTYKSFEGSSPFKDAVLRAYREVLSYAATTANPLGPIESFAGLSRTVDGITPVHFTHARAARRCCFSNFDPDIDGTVRRVALSADHKGRLLAQLGFAVGWDALGLSAARVELRADSLRLHSTAEQGRSLSIQLDDDRTTLIPWVKGHNWTKQFLHLPASAVLRLHDLRENERHNRRESIRILQFVFASELLPAFNELGQLLESWTQLESEAEWARLSGDTELRTFCRQQLDTLDTEATGGQQRLREYLREQQRLLAGDPAEAAISAQVADDVRFYLGEVERLTAAQTEIRQEIERTQSRLIKAFENRVCILGYTATSLADMVPIPTHRRAPGMMAHANIVNGMLTGQWIRWSTPAVIVPTTAIMGLLATIVSTLLRPRLGALLILFMIVSFAAIGGALVFYRWHYWLALTPPIAATALAYALIASYRYVFVEGERRQLATALGQYTSKEMARQMAENPELCRRAEMREVTAIFTDLMGFTTIAERIGAKRTQEVLNVTLGRFTDVIIRHEGMVNKFIGDGIFAFWNPVIYPQEDHARRACVTAVDLLVGLEEMRREQAEAGGDEAFADIVLRVGIATGNAIVGPCGSEQKYDYTCIGDSVNVAARLESANKFFGTRVLVSGVARDQSGDGFEFRPLGGVRVKGKHSAVPVYELLGRQGEVAEEDLRYAAAFGHAVELFQQREWTRALNAFQECQQSRPDDLATENYIEAAASLLGRPPGPDWIGAIELREK